jgi:siroheme synthase
MLLAEKQGRSHTSAAANLLLLLPSWLPAHHFPNPQAEIHELLLDFAEAGATVIRLKGGDPYVFGRGGEEVQYLQQHGINVHCVPGITAAAGICAELGIPMTHR